MRTPSRWPGARPDSPPTPPCATYPRLSPLERLRPAESSEDKSAALAQVRLEAWGPIAHLATELGLPSYGPLMLPGGWTIR